ncbi:plasmid pRiA4b ORF-3 family protein [candidate division KSB1 bacterium]|nr:plasmid pRiA4b ORF-3 family protein [candidate division KSB1 bacterium]
MLVYQFKVALEHDKRTYRNIEILENHTLSDLHREIYWAFNRFDEHLYSFYLTRKPVRGWRKRANYPEYTVILYPADALMAFEDEEKYDASKTKIGTLKLKEKDILYYLFDYGDQWWHQIKVLSITETNTPSEYPKLVKIVGKSPEQYPDYENEA